MDLKGRAKLGTTTRQNTVRSRLPREPMHKTRVSSQGTSDTSDDHDAVYRRSKLRRKLQEMSSRITSASADSKYGDDNNFTSEFSHITIDSPHEFYQDSLDGNSQDQDCTPTQDSGQINKTGCPKSVANYRQYSDDTVDHTASWKYRRELNDAGCIMPEDLSLHTEKQNSREVVRVSSRNSCLSHDSHVSEREEKDVSLSGRYSDQQNLRRDQLNKRSLSPTADSCFKYRNNTMKGRTGSSRVVVDDFKNRNEQQNTRSASAGSAVPYLAVRSFGNRATSRNGRSISSDKVQGTERKQQKKEAQETRRDTRIQEKESYRSEEVNIYHCDGDGSGIVLDSRPDLRPSNEDHRRQRARRDFSTTSKDVNTYSNLSTVKEEDTSEQASQSEVNYANDDSDITQIIDSIIPSSKNTVTLPVMRKQHKSKLRSTMTNADSESKENDALISEIFALNSSPCRDTNRRGMSVDALRKQTAFHSMANRDNEVSRKFDAAQSKKPGVTLPSKGQHMSFGSVRTSSPQRKSIATSPVAIPVASPYKYSSSVSRSSRPVRSILKTSSEDDSYCNTPSADNDTPSPARSSTPQKDSGVSRQGREPTGISAKSKTSRSISSKYPAVVTPVPKPRNIPVKTAGSKKSELKPDYSTFSEAKNEIPTDTRKILPATKTNDDVNKANNQISSKLTVQGKYESKPVEKQKQRCENELSDTFVNGSVKQGYVSNVPTDIKESIKQIYCNLGLTDNNRSRSQLSTDYQSEKSSFASVTPNEVSKPSNAEDAYAKVSRMLPSHPKLNSETRESAASRQKEVDLPDRVSSPAQDAIDDTRDDNRTESKGSDRNVSSIHHEHTVNNAQLSLNRAYDSDNSRRTYSMETSNNAQTFALFDPEVSDEVKCIYLWDKADFASTNADDTVDSFKNNCENGKDDDSQPYEAIDLETTRSNTSYINERVNGTGNHSKPDHYKAEKEDIKGCYGDGADVQPKRTDTKYSDMILDSMKSRQSPKADTERTDETLELAKTQQEILSLIDRVINSTSTDTAVGSRASWLKPKREVSMKLDLQRCIDFVNRDSQNEMDSNVSKKVSEAVTSSLISKPRKFHSRSRKFQNAAGNGHHVQDNSEDSCSITGSELKAGKNPSYSHLLQKLRWGYLKHIKREVKKLEDLERYLESYNRQKKIVSIFDGVGEGRDSAQKLKSAENFYQ